MTERRKDGMTEDRKGSVPEIDFHLRELTIGVTVEAADFEAFAQVYDQHKETGPDILRVYAADALKADVLSAGKAAIHKDEKGLFLDFPTIFAPGKEEGAIRCVIAGEVRVFSPPVTEPAGQYRRLVERLTQRNAAQGWTVPDVAVALPLFPLRTESFPVAAGFAWTPHKLAERRPGGLFKYPEEDRRRFFELRTPLNTVVGLALFSRTDPQDPGGWQEVKLADLTDRVFCLSQRDAPRRDDQRKDVLVEVVKLHTTRNAYVRYNFVKYGRFYERETVIGSEYAIPILELVYKDEKGRRILPSDPALRDLVIPLEIESRRAYSPDGSEIKALPADRFALDRIRWRWNPSFADDLKNEPTFDKAGRVRKDKKGKTVRSGWNIRVAIKIFDALFRLRADKAYLAAELLFLLATDIYKTRLTALEGGRNVLERSAERLFDLLDLRADPKHPERPTPEDKVAAAIWRLKQPDIGALLPGTDEKPRPASDAVKASGRRKAPFYRLVRSAEYSVGSAIISKEEADELKAEEVGPPAQAPALPAPAPVPDGIQGTLPGLDLPPDPEIPTGAEIRAARNAAGWTLRRFADAMEGPNFSTWARYENGKPIKVKPDVWQRVRDFIASPGKNKTPDVEEGKA